MISFKYAPNTAYCKIRGGGGRNIPKKNLAFYGIGEVAIATLQQLASTPRVNDIHLDDIIGRIWLIGRNTELSQRRREAKIEEIKRLMPCLSNKISSPPAPREV